MKIKLILLLVMFSHISFAQSVSGNFSISPDPYHSKKLDQSQYIVGYKYTFLEKENDKNSSQTGFVELQVGKKYTKFTDYFKLKQDSILEVHSHYKSVTAKEINEMLPVRSRIKFNLDIIRGNGKVVYQGEIPSSTYEFETVIPKLSWKISKDEKKIAGYKARKATTSYGGRQWTAWFCEDIPVQSGPYVFEGLPGLIIELYDSKENFVFTLNSISQTSKEIYKNLPEKLTKTTKENFFRLEKTYHDNPDLFFSADFIETVGSHKLPYNPIEKIN